MIPAHNHSDVLPPFTGVDPTIPTEVSPYDTTVCDLIDRFATSPERREILKGYLDYRALFAPLGFVDGYQWINGSFVENIESREGRPPNDIDVVTLAHRPISIRDTASWSQFFADNLAFFDPNHLKQTYKCDAYYIDLDLAPYQIVINVSYWHGLFSHRRDGLWKGMLRVPLRDDDVAAKTKLAGLS